MILYIVIILHQMASVAATVDCIEVRTQEKGFIRLTVEFDATAQGYTSNITTVNQILREVFMSSVFGSYSVLETYDISDIESL